MPRVVKMAVLNDYGMLSDRDEEYAALCVRYKKFLAPIKVKPQHLDAFTPAVGTNLVLFDYGGMMPGSEGLITFNCREVLKWAEDNPKSMVIVTSVCTWDWYFSRVAEEMGFRNSDGWDLKNVDLDNGLDGDPLPTWFKEQFR